VAQMNAAAQAALDYPRRHAGLLEVLARGADPADLNAVAATPETEAARKEYMEARSRVGHRIQRNLDGFQISLSARWRWLMQLVAIAGTVLLVEIAVFGFAAIKANTATVLVAGLLGLAGGYLAPVTRDIVAAVQSLRK